MLFFNSVFNTPIFSTVASNGTNITLPTMLAATTQKKESSTSQSGQKKTTTTRRAPKASKKSDESSSQSSQNAQHAHGSQNTHDAHGAQKENKARVPNPFDLRDARHRNQSNHSQEQGAYQDTNQNQEKKTPLGAGKRGMRPGTLLLLLLIVVFAISFFTNNISNFNRTEIPYSQFLLYVESNQVSNLTIVDQNQIRGQITNTGAQFTTMIPYFDAELLKRLAEKGIIFSGAAKPITFFQILTGILPWAIMLFFLFYMMRSLRGFGGGSMPFVKGKIRTYTKNSQKKILFDDVAGQKEAKYELEEVVEFLKSPERFQKIGARIPRGVLLVGSPGTGKTLLARACAGEAQVNFFYMSGSDFVEMFAGVGASRVRELFDQARKNSPCIVFIDELDAVGRSRSTTNGGGVHDEREQTLNQLLVEMDGFDVRDKIIVLAATNRPDILDKALLRPGRFDRQVVVDMPDQEERQKILELHAKNVGLHSDVNLNTISRATVGCSGADLANLVNEAALFAARHKRNKVKGEDFEEARDKILMGSARKSKIISPEEKLRTARHESGHALLHLFLRNADPLHKVTIIPRGRALGVAFSLPEKDAYGRSESYLLDRISICYGGYIAENMYYKEHSTGVQNDLQQATQIASKMVKEWGMSNIGAMSFSDEDQIMYMPIDIPTKNKFSESTAEMIDREIKRILNMAFKKAEDIIQKNRDKMDILTEALIKQETLLGDEVHELLKVPKPQTAH